MSPPPLPRRIRLRRQELRLPVSRAAKLAGVNRATWTAWEQGHATPSSASHGAIEHVLGWPPGTVAEMLSDYVDPATGQEYVDPDERRLWDLRHDLGLRYVAEHGEERAAELGAERARDLIAYLRARTAMQPPPNPRPAQVA